MGKSKLSLREFAGMVLKDPVVQHRILKQARTGTLPPRVLVELFHYYGGPPPAEPELPSPDPTRAEARAQVTRRMQLYELYRKMEGPPSTA